MLPFWFLFHLQMFFFNYYLRYGYIKLCLGNRTATFSGKGCQLCLLSVFFCRCLILLVSLSLWCCELDVHLIVTEFTYLLFKEKDAFFTSKDHKHYTLWQKVCEALSLLLDNIIIWCGTNYTNTFLSYLRVQIVLHLPLLQIVSVLLMLPFSNENQANIAAAFNLTPQYLDD